MPAAPKHLVRNGLSAFRQRV